MQNGKPLRGKGLHSRSNPRETGPEAFILSILRTISAVAFSTSERVRQYTILPLNAICWCIAFTFPVSQDPRGGRIMGSIPHIDQPTHPYGSQSTPGIIRQSAILPKLGAFLPIDETMTPRTLILPRTFAKCNTEKNINTKKFQSTDVFLPQLQDARRDSLISRETGEGKARVGVPNLGKWEAIGPTTARRPWVPGSVVGGRGLRRWTSRGGGGAWRRRQPRWPGDASIEFFLPEHGAPKSSS